MTILATTLFAAFAGFALGMKFKAYILIPVCVLSVVALSIDQRGLLAVLLAVIGIQVGYIVGLVIRGICGALWATRVFVEADDLYQS